MDSEKKISESGATIYFADTVQARLNKNFNIDDINNLVERMFMTDGAITRGYFDTIFDVIKSIKEIFADGFQWWKDSLALGALVPKILGLYLGIGKVKEDAKLLELDQKKEIIKEYLPKGVDILWTDNGIEDESLGIAKITAILDDLACLTDDGIGVAADGKVDLSDLQYLPDVCADVYGIIHNAGNAIEECKHLGKATVTTLLLVMMTKIFKYIS